MGTGLNGEGKLGKLCEEGGNKGCKEIINERHKNMQIK